MEVNLSNNGGEATAAAGSGTGGNSDDRLMDRSKVRILLCDNDAKSLEHALALLINCSYQVISVRSARQVIDALNAEGPVIDIILAEVDLPMSKGMKMLKYITRDKDLRRIPVIMMSSLDEASIVVKSLRLGAADYLVKPLRSNELLNLWTHVWRRRRLLDLAKKNIMIYDMHTAGSDLSDTTTSSTTPFSDDTIDKSCNNLEIGLSIHQEESNVAATDNAEPPITNATSYQPTQPLTSNHQTGQSSLGLNNSNWKVGESSAFFAYVKSNMPNNNNPQEPSDFREAVQVQVQHPVVIENTTQALSEQPGINDADPSHLIREHQVGVSSFRAPTHLPYPYYMPSFYPQHGHLPYMPPMPPNPHYPCNMGLPWPSLGDTGPFSGKVKAGKVSKREAALLKFRQKRLTRCFDKKIRYLKRKDMADSKPRVKGKFVRKRNGIDVDLNSRPSCSVELDDDDDEDDVEDNGDEDLDEQV